MMIKMVTVVMAVMLSHTALMSQRGVLAVTAHGGKYTVSVYAINT